MMNKIYTMILHSGVNVSGITSSILNVGDVLKGFAVPVCTIVLIVSGLALMAGQQGRQWAKPTMLFAGIGLLIVVFAANIVESLNASFIGV